MLRVHAKMAVPQR